MSEPTQFFFPPPGTGAVPNKTLRLGKRRGGKKACDRVCASLFSEDI